LFARLRATKAEEHKFISCAMTEIASLTSDKENEEQFNLKLCSPKGSTGLGSWLREFSMHAAYRDIADNNHTVSCRSISSHARHFNVVILADIFVNSNQNQTKRHSEAADGTRFVRNSLYSDCCRWRRVGTLPFTFRQPL
jgi:hypothetical protein